MGETRVAKKNGTFRNMNKTLLFLTLFLFVFGTLSIVSASANESISRYGYSIFHYFFRHVIMLGLGSILGLIILKLPTRWYRLISLVLWPTITIVLIILFLSGSAKRGAVNWYKIPVLNIIVQPSEFSKPIIIIAIASLFEIATVKLKKGLWSSEKVTAFWIVIGCVIPGIVILSGDMGTAGIILAISGFLYLIGPLDSATRNKHILYLIGFGLICIFLLYVGKGSLLTNEQTERLTEFFNPCSKYEDSGYQICNCFIAINDGGLTGLGISKSKQKYSYIPEAYTDSIFAIVIEEDGLIWGLVILLVYFIMLANILKISNQTKSLRGRYITFGVAVYFFIHILFNLGGLLGILPFTGVPLPLISYGGSFTVSFIVALAMVQRVNIENRLSLNN